MSQGKIDVEISDEGTISFSVYDLIQGLGREGTERIAEVIACDDLVWKEIERQVREDYAGENFDRRIYLLRMAFIESSHFPGHLVDMFKALMEENGYLRAQLGRAEKHAYNWQRWYQDHHQTERYYELPVKGEPFQHRQYLQDSPVRQFLLDNGVNLEEIQEELQDGSS